MLVGARLGAWQQAQGGGKQAGREAHLLQCGFQGAARGDLDGEVHWELGADLPRLHRGQVAAGLHQACRPGNQQRGNDKVNDCLQGRLYTVEPHAEKVRWALKDEAPGAHLACPHSHELRPGFAHSSNNTTPQPPPTIHGMRLLGHAVRQQQQQVQQAPRAVLCSHAGNGVVWWVQRNHSRDWLWDLEPAWGGPGTNGGP